MRHALRKERKYLPVIGFHLKMKLEWQHVNMLANYFNGLINICGSADVGQDASYTCGMHLCFCKWIAWTKRFPQLLQGNGFSPVWIRWCIFKFPKWENLFPHSSQGNGFSPVWVYWCLFKGLRWVKVFPHSSQRNGFFPLCPNWCTWRWTNWAKLWPHWSQE